MGEVWRARHLLLNSDVAIKFIHTELSGTSDVAGRFVREAQAAAALRSAHVVQILDYGVEGPLAYQVMELLEGESVAHRLRRELIPPAELARILTHVARALGKAHAAGIVHRDLKPDNVFLTRSDDELIAKVLDFGIAKFRANPTGGKLEHATRTGALLGTPYYMSPEQAEGTRDVDHRADIWAMGVIAFECLIGQKPFDSDALGNLLLKICTHPLPVPSAFGKVPPGFDDWFTRTVNRDVSQRFQSAKEAADALSRVCNVTVAPQSNEPVVARPNVSQPGAPALALTNEPVAATLDPVKPRSRGRRLAITGVVGIAVIGAIAYFGRTRESEPTPPTPATPPVESETERPAPAPSNSSLQSTPPAPTPSQAASITAPAPSAGKSPVKMIPRSRPETGSTVDKPEDVL